MSKSTHVRFFRKNGAYYAKISGEDGEYLLDLGTDESVMQATIKVLTEEYGGIRIHPGEMN